MATTGESISISRPSCRDLGVLAFPMDCLPESDFKVSQEFPQMYWRYGQRILRAAETIVQDPRLFPDLHHQFRLRARFLHHPFLQRAAEQESPSSSWRSTSTLPTPASSPAARPSSTASGMRRLRRSPAAPRPRPARQMICPPAPSISLTCRITPSSCRLLSPSGSSGARSFPRRISRR